MGGAIRLGLAALGLLCGLTARAQSPVWALRGAHNTVYLAESVHLLKAERSALPTQFEPAYATARTIVMEVDLSHLDAAQMQSWMLTHGTLSDATLQQVIGDPLYRRVADQAEGLGLPMQILQQFQPWAVALMLADLEYVKLGYDPEWGVEQQIERRAQHDGKEILGLETLDAELGELAGLSPAEQSRFLQLTVEDLHDAQTETDQLLDAWRGGKTEQLAKLLASEYDSFPELYRALITDRNARWLPQIQGYLHDSHDYLVIVGALHLVGRGGLLDLARRAGLEVTPVLN
ncbi:MAG TPA: TraB/GumN family protein [Steroidobacteraceae bacterium]|nr:TraB/GumN family protein [Steroidobacteraceae bacterium]